MSGTHEEPVNFLGKGVLQLESQTRKCRFYPGLSIPGVFVFLVLSNCVNAILQFANEISDFVNICDVGIRKNTAHGMPRREDTSAGTLGVKSAVFRIAQPRAMLGSESGCHGR
jgi:hypothetical protein